MTPRSWVIATPAQRDRLAAYFARLQIERPIAVKVEDYRHRRTVTQNARLWALHTKASEVTGYSPDEMHEFALMRYFGSEEIEVGGVRMMRPLKRSSSRNTKEFAAFMEATEAWYGTEFGCWLD